MPENRCIVHMDLDSFFVSVARLLNPTLKGKPVIVGGDSNRGVVSSCSYEARAFGVHAAMPIQQAKRLCPQAIIVGGQYEHYTHYSDMVTDVIASRVPVLEKSSIDEFYIDLSGMDRFFGCYQLATEIRQQIMKETGLPISFGMATGKLVAKVATGEAKPNGQLKIDPGYEKEFLAPMMVEKIPMIGSKTTITLRTLGIEKVKHLQNANPKMIEQVLGKNGIELWKKVNGMDDSPVIPHRERKSASMEETFDTDSGDVNKMLNLMLAMTEKLCHLIRQEDKLCTCVGIRIRYSDFDTQSIQCTVPATCFDHVVAPKIKELFHRLYNPERTVRLVGVRLANLMSGTQQLDLFDNSATMSGLYNSIDKVRERFGNDKIQKAVSQDARLRSFNPFNGIRK